MSLKAFHIIFILASLALSVGFGAWGVIHYQATAQASFLIMGIGSFLAGVVLMWYGPWFLRKYKDLSFL